MFLMNVHPNFGFFDIVDLARIVLVSWYSDLHWLYLTFPSIPQQVGTMMPLCHASKSMDEEEEHFSQSQSQATSDNSSCPAPQLGTDHGSLGSGFIQVVSEPVSGHEVLSAGGLLDDILLDKFKPGGAVH
jgi:hypothetical protein